jgi:hypothetical protein
MRRIILALSLFLTLLTNPPALAGDGVLYIAPDQLVGYDRGLFKHWIDADKDGCDTRAEVLIAEAIVKPKIGAKCKLTKGRWLSVYDGKIHKNASKLDVDHLIPLAEAWRSGAWSWSDQKRMEFANDIDDEWALNAVTASVNRSKGDKDISTWLPKKSICQYLAGWVSIKAKYEMTVDAQEAKVIAKYYDSCGLGYVTKESLVTPTPAPTDSASPTPTPSQSPTPNTSLTATPTPTLRIISPGSFCSQLDAGQQGKNSKGVIYTCKVSDTENRLRWRQ